MNPIGGSLARILRRQLPAASALLAVLLDLMPLPDAAPERLFPLLTPVVAFHWALRRPDLFTPLTFLLVGLVMDAAGGLPLGTSGLALLAACALVHGRERTLLAQPPLLLWGGFALFLAVFEAVRWAVASAWHDFEPRPLMPVLGEYLVTVLVQPLLVPLLAPLERLVERPRHATGSR